MGNFANWIKELRVHQWLKNLLVFLPLLLAHHLNNLKIDFKSVLSFFAFSLTASATYLLNDLKDLDSDQLHPVKSKRPIASGLISRGAALIAAALFLLISALMAFYLGRNFVIALSIYLLLTIGYTYIFKKIIILDLVLITIFYLIRIMAGGAATNISTSYWMLGFSTFFFLSLAFAKRYAELLELSRNDLTESNRRGYQFSDQPILMALGVASGYASIIIFSLYLNTNEVTLLYHSPEIMWGLVPVLTYWISWIWIQAHRGNMYEDPLLFAFDRKESRATILIALLVTLAANYIHLKSHLFISNLK